ncbi:hypothetical protein SAMN06265365_14328 [Tistlia consotensis]|uniref:Uncharacterized protein n=1 Tax=Tistlia consotensis USBA 355 TaxID=560819 RepID=A0A1Y6BGM6_9PROT|nr:hypothetical protein [Tistlia consotensis]SMF02258.1 hypothetical protein SAMN05428998_10337 [Tistlia consotensis USBA 355]SNS26577.1 hypothetical protein SAMN06265365_14328 [Tistlia consotensis]
MHLRDAFRASLSWLALPALAVLLLQIGAVSSAVRLEQSSVPGLQLLHAPTLVGLALVVLGGSLALWVDTLLRRRDLAVARRDGAYGRRRRYTQVAAEPAVATGPSRDVGLAEALAYVSFRSWGRSPAEVAALGEEAEQDRCRQLLEALCDGSLTLWGRRRDDGGLEAIPSADWRALRDACDPGRALALTAFRAGPIAERYDHLLASRDDLERRWPPYRDGSGLRFGEPRVATREDFHGRPVLVRCLLTLDNLGATRLRGCTVVAETLETPRGEQSLGFALSSRPRGSGSAYAGAWATQFSLPAGDRRELMITERVIEKRGRNGPHRLKLDGGDLPLDPGASYLLSIAAAGERGAPLRVRLRLTIDADQRLTAELA